MNADDMKRLLEKSLHEGGMEGAPGPDETLIAGRVRGARRRRVAASGLAGVASIALVAAVVWQVGGFSNEPNPPATPTTTIDPTDDPTGDPTETATETPTDDPTDDPTGGETDPADWSDAVFPECGDTFAGLPERTSQLVATQGPSETLGTGGGQWLTQVENTGATPIQADVALSQTVVVDSAGTVVATVDMPDDVIWGAEGGFHLAIEPGETLPFRVQGSYECAGDAGPLGDGEYEVYVMFTMGDAGSTAPDDLEQAQGGPFPLVIDESVETSPVELDQPDGAVSWAHECQAPWTEPAIETGFELEVIGTQIRSERAATDDIAGGETRLTVTQRVTGTLYNDVVLIQDGQIVSPGLFGDSQSEYSLSAGSEIDLGFGSSLLGCDGTTLPPGDYQAVVVTLLHQWSAGAEDGSVTSIVAATDPVDLELT
ncbi:hypothetical protein [Pseudactinotalea sp.]|uniref:hypothetical protein n=1 Tax=Pseudactinotalea sp. TaxID=1926260 RepID=UPI003B3B8926